MPPSTAALSLSTEHETTLALIDKIRRTATEIQSLVVQSRAQLEASRAALRDADAGEQPGPRE
jgi:hypothetical protein